jgi:hypothetical protein
MRSFLSHSARSSLHKLISRIRQKVTRKPEKLLAGGSSGESLPENYTRRPRRTPKASPLVCDAQNALLAVCSGCGWRLHTGGPAREYEAGSLVSPRPKTGAQPAILGVWELGANSRPPVCTALSQRGADRVRPFCKRSVFMSRTESGERTLRFLAASIQTERKKKDEHRPNQR